jgi:hypothetical protein
VPWGAAAPGKTTSGRAEDGRGEPAAEGREEAALEMAALAAGGGLTTGARHRATRVRRAISGDGGGDGAGR